jgi:glycosyltransferase involved in cell wall biosynthesis
LRGGGIEKYTLELGSRLVHLGHEVTVYSMMHYGETPLSIKGMKIIPVYSFRKPCLEKMSASIFASLHTVFRGSYDIIHLHSVASGACGLLSRIRHIATVLQMHGIEWQRSHWGKGGAIVLKLLEKLSIREAIAITAVSKQQCSYLQNHYGCDAEYIPTATIIPEKILPHKIKELDIDSGSYILFASRLVSEKGAHFLIKAFRNIQTDKKLVIAGGSNGDASYKRELILLSNGDNRILFTGHIEGQLLAELFSNAYLYVQPSTIEGLSISLLEAMSYGRCCLVSDIPENLEPLSENGFCFRNQDVKDLTLKLQYLINNAEQVKKIGSKAIDRVRTEYSWDIVTHKMESFYYRVLNMNHTVGNSTTSHTFF